MTNVKRSLSVLLAVVMVFTTMAVAFTVVSSAAPTVPRTASVRLSPTVELTVPEVLQTFGTDYYEGGSNIKPEGEIQATITSMSNDEVQNIALSCSDAGVQISARVQQGEGCSAWQVQGGTLKTAPSDDGTTRVKWTLSCTVGGKTYVTYAWSQVQPHYNNPGFSVYVRHQYKVLGLGGGILISARPTYNWHVEWIQPAFGEQATESGSHVSQCYVQEGVADQVTVADKVYAASYYWNWDKGNGDNETDTAPVVAKGSIYADVSQVSDLNEVGMCSRAKPHQLLASNDPSNRPQYYRGTSITAQSINGSSTSRYSVTQTGSTKVGLGVEIGDVFSGSLPDAGETATIKAQIEWEGDVERGVDHPWKSYQRTICKYTMTIVSYDKTELWAAISKATRENYQAEHFRNAAPAGNGYGAFRSWDQYFAALQYAWYVYGRKDVTQSMIDEAEEELSAALPTYNGTSGKWVSGMMYADANYSQIDTNIATIPETLDPDFFEDYSDGTHGKYYQYTLAAALNDALADIAYDRPLDARYQKVVDQMRANLMNAVNALVETTERQTTKLVSIEFVSDLPNVTNMPDPITTRLTGYFRQPLVSPSRQYYEFTGWYYDAEATQRVTWPIYIDWDNEHFKADLDVKNDNAGVAYTVYAGWRVSGKELAFETNGGSAMEPVVGANGAPYSGPTEVPTKAGHRFLGWYADEELTTPVDWSTFKFGDLEVVYAAWGPDTFSVTFYAVDGEFTGGDKYYTVTDLYGSTVVAPLPPSMTDAGFEGWYYDYALTEPVDLPTLTITDENIWLYAKYNTAIRTVTFNAQNNTSPVALTCSMGGQVNEPETPERDGYTFKGWYNSAASAASPTGIVVEFPIAVRNKNIVLYGGWTAQNFTVTFDPGDGSMAEDFDPSAYENLPCGSVLTPPADPTKPEYVFAGWTLNGEPYTLTTVPAEDITLVATYVEEPYVATFRLRTDVTGSVEQGDVITATVSLMANRVVTNHRFVVYYDSRYLQPALNGNPVTSNITGTSACSKIPKRAYFTLVRNAGGHNVTDCGTPTGRIMPESIAPATQFFPEDWVVSNTELKPEYSYYKFVYFDAPDVSSGTRSRPTSEQDLASFQFIVREDAPLANGETTYAQLLLSPDFTRTPDRPLGKTGACLQKDTTYTNVKEWDNTTNVVVDGDHRFAVTQMHSCCINFETNGGDAVASIDNAKQGKTIALPTPTRSYYNFLGWTVTNDPDDTAYVSMTAYPVPNTDTVTLYAKWVGKSVNYYVRHHKQNLDGNGFLDPYQQTLKAPVGTVVTATPMVYDGFTCSNPSESGLVTGDKTMVIDLWYMRNTTKITLRADGGQFANGSEEVYLSGKYEVPVTGIPEDPTRAGYTFEGWLCDGSNYVIDKYPATDITLTARWTAKTITVHFFLNGEELADSPMVGTYGDPITLPTVTPPENYLFTGWKDANDVPFTSSTFPADDLNLYGTTVIDGYVLTLYINGVMYGEPIDVYKEVQVTEALIGYTADPGYRFTGWRLQNSKDAALATFPMTLTQDTTLYGFTDRETYSITTYVFYEGAYEAGPTKSNLNYGMPFELPEPDDFTAYGYGFKGWYTDPERTKLYVKPDTMPAENLVLYGEYYVMTGTIEFDLNGGYGTKPASITKNVGQTAQLPGGTGIARKYYTFGGWSTSPTGTTAITSYTFMGEGVVKMYAIWKINYATVNFDLNGAEAGTQPESMQVEVGEMIAAAALPDGADFAKTGFIFLGWSDKNNAKTALDSYTPTSVGSKTLYAVWVADTVTLIARDGSTTVIDTENHFIYGLKVGITKDELLNEYLDVLGNGHLEVKLNKIGTGVEVNVINDFSGEIDDTYTIIIFGDVNGDGIVNSTDVTKARNMSAKLEDSSLSNPYAFAANVNVDSVVNSSDVTTLRSVAAKLFSIDQVTRQRID